MQDEETAETSAQDGPWQGEVPGSRRQLGHGLYAFDLDGPVPMHIVAGPPMRTVKYRPGMEAELSQSSGTSPDEAPAVEESAASRPVNSPEFRDAMVQELKAAHQAGTVKLAPGNEILPAPDHDPNPRYAAPRDRQAARDADTLETPEGLPPNEEQLPEWSAEWAAAEATARAAAEAAACEHRPGGMRSMRWNLLWYLPLVAPALILLGCFDALEFYRQGRVILSHFSWALVFSPAADIWCVADIVSVALPFQTLVAIPGMFDPGADEYKHRYRSAAVSLSIALVGVLLLWVLAWGSFPFDKKGDDIYMRMIPFVPWPSWPF